MGFARAVQPCMGAPAGHLGTLPTAVAAGGDLLLAALHGLRAGPRVAGRLAGMWAVRQRPPACLAALLLRLQDSIILQALALTRYAQAFNMVRNPFKLLHGQVSHHARVIAAQRPLLQYQVASQRRSVQNVVELFNCNWISFRSRCYSLKAFFAVLTMAIESPVTTHEAISSESSSMQKWLTKQHVSEPA